MNILPLPAFTDNYIWLIEENGKATVVDPGDAEVVNNYLKEKNLELENILITHHHFDHVGGTLELKEQIDGKVYGPVGNIEGIDIHVTENDTVKTLDYEFSVLETPGHTLDHIALSLIHI